MDFEWDDSKEELNRKKHGVEFAEAETVFADLHSLEILDDNNDEERWVRLGRSSLSRLLVIVYCHRLGRIRIISARLATKNEKRKYLIRGIYER